MIKPFENIVFQQKEHKYFVNGEEFVSVSKFIDDLIIKPDFDIAADIIEQYTLGDVITDQWKEKAKQAIELGNNIHKFAEQFVKDKVSLSYNDRYFLRKKAVIDFMAELIKAGIIVEETEFIMYDERLKVAGTADMICSNQKYYYIFDWKTNADLSKFVGKSKITGTNVTLIDKYRMQLSMYAIMLEQVVDKPIAIAVVHITDNGYELIKLKRINKNYFYDSKRNYRQSSTYVL